MSDYNREMNDKYPQTAIILYQAETNHSMKSRRRRKSHRISAAMLCVCVFASSLFGFVGGYVSNHMRDSALINEYTAAIQTLSAQVDKMVSDSVTRETSGGLNSEVIAATAAATGDTATRSVSDTAALVKPSVVEIATETTSLGLMGQYVTPGAGSGVIITADGYIVTNFHVIDGARSISVRLADGSEFPATVRGSDAKTDLALIKIEKTGLRPAVQGNSATLKIGDPAIAVGNPLGKLGGTVTAGIISALDREIVIDDETFSLLQTDAAINPGNSGGGLFNLAGELIGVVNVKTIGTEIEGLGFAIPINTAKSVIQDLMAYGYVRGRIDTGLTLVDIQNSRTAFMYNVNQTGLYVYKSVNKSLQNGDRITAVNGTAIADQVSFNAVVNACKVGDTLQITVVRGGQTITIPLTLTELHV